MQQIQMLQDMITKLQVEKAALKGEQSAIQLVFLYQFNPTDSPQLKGNPMIY